MKQAVMSDCRDPQNRSTKYCVCGSHSVNDSKKNMNHHGTASKINIREARKLKIKGAAMS